MNGTIISWEPGKTSNDGPSTLSDSAVGYIFQNDIVALKQVFSLSDIGYTGTPQYKQLAAALKC